MKGIQYFFLTGRLAIIASIIALLASCGFSKSFISSAPEIGESIGGPQKVMRYPEFAITFDPRNDVQLGQVDYVVLIPYRASSGETQHNKVQPGKFRMGISLFPYQKGLTLDLSQVTIEIDGKHYTTTSVFPYPYAHYPTEQAKRFSDKIHGCPESQPRVFQGSLPKQPINLEANGLWSCYELEFSVNTPSPRTHFKVDLNVNNERNQLVRAITIPFSPYNWGHSDSFP
ncbi:hypothetical protein [Endozoicomonas sp.]|uniref:hypothetical protein n=1 Tax=Endozoicomonas sp. TaxID=1892382 RepID=UPI003AF66548